MARLAPEKVEELQRIVAVWGKLPDATRDAIGVLAGVVKVRPPEPAKRGTRTRKGAVPAWLPTGLTILEDSGGQLSDRRIAERLGVSPSTLTRNEVFQRAREAYPPDFKTGRPRQ